MMKRFLFLFTFSISIFNALYAQTKPVFFDSSDVLVSEYMLNEPLPSNGEMKEANPKGMGVNKVVPGKGLPKYKDRTRQKEMGKIPARDPFTFQSASPISQPTDPTGAVGPNHYMNAFNSGFRIWDKNGNPLIPEFTLSSIGGAFTGENEGDPIVLYDQQADRFVLIQLSTGPERPFSGDDTAAILVAVSRGPDPVSSGWYTYRFETGTTPDYPKISVWGDAYYITTNKDPLSPESSQVVFALERDKMLQGANNVQILGFPLPGIENNGFYSPAGFNAVGDELPPPGNAPIIYFQDDSWQNISRDHLKIWLINVDWNNPGNSRIELSQEITEGVSPFLSVFDGGDFANLTQPGNNVDLDVLQSTVMYSTQYRRFPTHNSVVLNFVVDLEPSAAEHAGIRWYELRQLNDGGPWQVYQEGTYAPDESHRFCGSIGMDVRGNIALGFTILNADPNNPIFPSLRYTGRLEGDPLGKMTFEEQIIADGRGPSPRIQGADYARYGDYSHLSIDPVDGLTFWFNGEVINPPRRADVVGVFKLLSDFPNDVGPVSLIEPQSRTLGANEIVRVRIRNFGSAPQSNFEVSYTVDGREPVTEMIEEVIEPYSFIDYTFEQRTDLSTVGETYSIVLRTDLAGDALPENNEFTKEVTHLFPRDIGILSIDAPLSGQDLSGQENVTVTIGNFGGEPQQNFPVDYQVNFSNPVTEIYEDVLEVGENAVYTFSSRANLEPLARYRIEASTNLDGDGDTSNDSKTKSIAHLDCIPKGSDCSFGDGISYFELGDLVNERIPCGDGYQDFINASATLDRSDGEIELTIISSFIEEITEEGAEKLSMWIDFNDNGVFEENERLITSAVITQSDVELTYTFNLSNDTPLGQHLLRIKAGDTSFDSDNSDSFDADLNNACAVMQYGTTHDYTVTIIDSTLPLKDFILRDAEIVVVTLPNDQYRMVLKTTNIDRPLNISVFNVLGQQLLQNEVPHNGEGYVYDLDMSYAAPGIYLLRLGTRDFGKVTRFIVK